jgi:hypothetical protein
MVPHIKHLHGKPIAACNPADQAFIWRRLHGLVA